MVAEFLGKQEGAEAGGEDAAGEKAGFERRGDGSGVGIAFANVDLTANDFDGEGGGINVEAFTDFLVDEAEMFGVLFDFGINDDALGGGEVFEGVLEFVSAFAALFLLWFSRRSCLFGLGAAGLFFFVLQEGHDELVMAHLFALGPVEFFEQGGDEVFLKAQFLTQSGVLRDEVFNLLVSLVDGISRAGGVPD